MNKPLNYQLPIKIKIQSSVYPDKNTSFNDVHKALVKMQEKVKQSFKPTN